MKTVKLKRNPRKGITHRVILPLPPYRLRLDICEAVRLSIRAPSGEYAVIMEVHKKHYNPQAWRDLETLLNFAMDAMLFTGRHE